MTTKKEEKNCTETPFRDCIGARDQRYVRVGGEGRGTGGCLTFPPDLVLRRLGGLKRLVLKVDKKGDEDRCAMLWPAVEGKGLAHDRSAMSG